MPTSSKFRKKVHFCLSCTDAHCSDDLMWVIFTPIMAFRGSNFKPYSSKKESFIDNSSYILLNWHSKWIFAIKKMTSMTSTRPVFQRASNFEVHFLCCCCARKVKEVGKPARARTSLFSLYDNFYTTEAVRRRQKPGARVTGLLFTGWPNMTPK